MPPINSRDARRNAGGAALLSLLLPGLGYLYAGRPSAAVRAFAGYHILAAFSIALVFIASLGTLAVVLPFLLLLSGWITIAVLSARSAARAPSPYPLQAYNRWYWYVLVIFVVGLVWQPLVFRIVRSRWVEAFRIPSPAMAPTLLSGDFLYVSKLPSARRVPPHHNDIVVMESPNTPGLSIIKRVVGLPGDTLAMRNGILFRNGSAAVEPFILPVESTSESLEELAEGRSWHVEHLVGRDTARYRPTMRNWGPIVVPQDSAYLLGDNRDQSFDSRFWGAVGFDRIRGRPLAVYFSIDPDRTAVRSERIGHRF